MAQNLLSGEERGEVGLRHAFLAVRVCACMFENAGIFSDRRSQVCTVIYVVFFDKIVTQRRKTKIK